MKFHFSIAKATEEGSEEVAGIEDEEAVVVAEDLEEESLRYVFFFSL